METLIGIASLGLLCLVVEIFNLRKLLAPLVILGLAVILVFNFYNWGTATKYYNDMFRVDNYSMSLSGVLIFLSILIALFGVDFYKKQEEHWSDYFSIFLFALCGGIILTGYASLIMLFLGIEILSISLYIMAGSNKWSLASNEAGMKYFILGSFATGFLLFGIALVYGATGTFHLEKISEAIANLNDSQNTLLYAGFFMILVGMFFKVAAVPFHFWSPDVYEGSPTIVTTFMASVAKIAAIAGFYRLIYYGFSAAMPAMDAVFITVIILTICTGNILALVQTNFKRMLAFSGISHAGFLILGLISIPLAASGQVLYYVLSYGIANVAAFGVAILVFKSMKSEKISAFNGLFKKKPLIAVCLSICMLSLASIPPLSGFWSKYFILSSAIQQGYIALAIIGILNSLLGVYYYFRIIAAMITQPADNTPVESNIIYNIVIVTCTAIIVILGIFPGIIVNIV